MNVTTIRYLAVGAIAAGSAAIGGTVGYILGRRSKCKKCPKSDWYDRAEELRDNEELDVDSGYFVKLDEEDIDPRYEEYKRAVEEYEKQASAYSSENGEKSSGERQMEIMAPNGHTRYMKRINGEEVWFEIDDDGAIHELVKRPHEITRNSFMNEKLEWDKESLEWYEGDNVLCGTYDEVVTPEEMKTLLGVDHISSQMFNGYLSEDDHSIFIRNGRIMTDYEIICREASYAMTVHGISPEELAAARKALNVDEGEE